VTLVDLVNPDAGADYTEALHPRGFHGRFSTKGIASGDQAEDAADIIADAQEAAQDLLEGRVHFTQGGLGVEAQAALLSQQEARELPRKVVHNASFAVEPTDKRLRQVTTPSDFVHPETGHAMGKSEIGDTFESLFADKGSHLIVNKFGGPYQIVSHAEGGPRNTPLDFDLDDLYGGELKTLNVNAKSQKTAIKKEEIDRKYRAIAGTGKAALMVVQVVDMKNRTVNVYSYPDFASKMVTRMDHLGSYTFTPQDFRNAQQASGHYEKREGRAVAQAIQEASATPTQTPSTTPGPNIDYGQLSPPDRKRLDAALDKQRRLLPDLAGVAQIKITPGLAEKQGENGKYTFASKTLELDPRIFTEDSAAWHAQAEANGYHPKTGANSVDYEVAHEIGHALDEKSNPRGAAYDAAGEAYPGIKTFGKLRPNGPAVSHYAGSKNSEIVPELWAEYSLAKNPRPETQQAGEAFLRSAGYGQQPTIAKEGHGELLKKRTEARKLYPPGHPKRLEAERAVRQSRKEFKQGEGGDIEGRVPKPPVRDFKVGDEVVNKLTGSSGTVISVRGTGPRQYVEFKITNGLSSTSYAENLQLKGSRVRVQNYKVGDKVFDAKRGDIGTVVRVDNVTGPRQFVTFLDETSGTHRSAYAENLRPVGEGTEKGPQTLKGFNVGQWVRIKGSDTSGTIDRFTNMGEAVFKDKSGRQHYVMTKLLTSDPLFRSPQGWTLDFVSNVTPQEKAMMTQLAIESANRQEKLLPGSMKGIQFVIDDPARTYFGALGNKDSVAAYTEQGTDKIVFHPRNFTTEQLYQTKLNLGGWWSGADHTFQFHDQVFAHEVGHKIANHLGQDSVPLNQSFWDKIGELLGVQPPNLSYSTPGGGVSPAGGLNRWFEGSDVKEAIKSQVSEYGASHPAELLAELWSEYSMKEYPRGPAEGYGKYIGGTKDAGYEYPYNQPQSPEPQPTPEPQRKIDITNTVAYRDLVARWDKEIARAQRSGVRAAVRKAINDRDSAIRRLIARSAATQASRRQALRTGTKLRGTK